VINVGPLRETAGRINPSRHGAGTGNRGEAHVNRTILAAATLTAGFGLLAAGCSSSGTNAAAKSSTNAGAKSGHAAAKSGTVTAAKSGTETISGTLKGAAAMTSSPVFHLTFRGPVDTTATYPVSSSPKDHIHTFTTAAGDFVIVSGMSVSTHKLLSTSTCRFEIATSVPYTVSGAKSTGKFAGATGHGKAVVLFQGDLPKLKSGKCNESTTAQPTVSTVVVTFKAAGPLTLK
jgi:hypothetical protein